MIEQDVIDYLKTDATLDTLLSVTASTDKFYPELAMQGVTKPYIIYSNSSGVLDEVLDEDEIELRIVSAQKSDSQAIRDRIKTLLDVQDEIQTTTLATDSTDFWIYYSKLTFQDSLSDATDLDDIDFIEVMVFSIKYKRKAWY